MLLLIRTHAHTQQLLLPCEKKTFYFSFTYRPPKGGGRGPPPSVWWDQGWGSLPLPQPQPYSELKDNVVQLQSIYFVVVIIIIIIPTDIFSAIFAEFPYRIVDSRTHITIRVDIKTSSRRFLNTSMFFEKEEER